MALGTLTCQIPGRKPFQYRFTADDLVTTARFLVGEAGGRDNAENRGTLWAMLNRYAFFRNQVPGWGSFGGFLAQYSQTLQPYLRYWASAKDFVAKCNSTFDNPGCQFQPTRSQTYPGTQVRMGQLKNFLKLQATPWAQLPEAARRLALQTLTGQIPNPIGNATEVADTKVYFQRANGRAPTRAEWEDYTRRFAASKNWDWRPQQVSYDQFGHNALFVTTQARKLPGRRDADRCCRRRLPRSPPRRRRHPRRHRRRRSRRARPVPTTATRRRRARPKRGARSRPTRRCTVSPVSAAPHCTTM